LEWCRQSVNQEEPVTLIDIKNILLKISYEVADLKKSVNSFELALSRLKPDDIKSQLQCMIEKKAQ
jgi:hypothetical protein